MEAILSIGRDPYGRDDAFWHGQHCVAPNGETIMHEKRVNRSRGWCPMVPDRPSLLRKEPSPPVALSVLYV
ncbi:uncharacterized protein K452DRAFT_283878 [Aplosporella prunicola CBS 121167]|uniref:Uncharacterized protein n=1 Tax=Aplosporella prunicola CBS 121167 TaxID=1176127 RepID=A0A6A6BN42_9PEZI|nr:uncharacterized protein K452DRAFT_283878 [Aplosporella prunicola CBS 121167]KAF2145522.1 hypothetical protein K452DRAFT_283878 [Aplosporella prunicola CBS 121167]